MLGIGRNRIAAYPKVPHAGVLGREPREFEGALFIERLSPEAFTWTKWRRFDLFMMLGVACRRSALLSARELLGKYAVGYCEAERLRCRPKREHTAVMFFANGEHSWCHMRDADFRDVFLSRGT